MSVPLPALRQWHHAVKMLPRQDRFLEASPHQKFLAWKGDKILGAQAARVVVEHTNIRSAGGASTLIAKALSNDFFTSHIKILLPKDVCPLLHDISSSRRNSHKVGTILEAAVAEVGNTQNGEAAIQDLSKWLIDAARNQETSHGSYQ